MASRQAVGVAVHRLTKKPAIRHFARGVYDFPKRHAVPGFLMPPADAIAHALAGRDRTRLQPERAPMRPMR